MITEQLVTERSIRGLKFVALRDGRRLSYTEYGAADGNPVPIAMAILVLAWI
jgi:hypothetical protein